MLSFIRVSVLLFGGWSLEEKENLKIQGGVNG
jgi:hypothetical protein